MDVDADEDIFGLTVAENFTPPQSEQSTTVTRPDPRNTLSPTANTGAVQAYFGSGNSISTMSNSVIDSSVTITSPASRLTDPSVTIPLATYIPAHSTTSKDTSITSEITSSTIHSILRDQQEQRRILDLILARLPPQQTGQSAGSSKMTRHGGLTADGQESSVASL